MAVSSSSSFKTIPQQSQEEEIAILLTFEFTNCSFCYSPLKVGSGILLQQCLHPFCSDNVSLLFSISCPECDLSRMWTLFVHQHPGDHISTLYKNCITTWIENADSVLINCPLECGRQILEREIKTLIPSDVFENIQKRSFEKAIMEMANYFKCKTPNCPGLCFIENDSKIYNCEVCYTTNCISCNDIHDGITCEEYKDEIQKCVVSGISNPTSHVKQMIQERNQTNGFQQLLSSSLTSSSLQKKTDNGSNHDNTEVYSDMMEIMTQNGFLNSVTAFECSVCYTDTPAGEGVILQECFHVFCKSCVISQIEFCENSFVSCLRSDCNSQLTPREIQTLSSNDILVPPGVLEKITRRNWKLAEAIIPNKFHCLEPNCAGFCELVGDVESFYCELCNKKNCIQCNAIHDGITCADHKNRIVQNANDELSIKELENLVSTGRAMRCSTCKAVVQKEVGCDAIVCTICQTHLCWATKGPRWGKNGVGDTSGGCRCRVGGVKCHRNCGNCH